jgi:uncharacterized membrane protein
MMAKRIQHIERIGRHVLRGLWAGTREFPPAILRNVEHEIAAISDRHQGDIHFVVEGALHGTPLLHNQLARERAIDIFSHFRLWDTPLRNGVLVYVLLADRTVDIVVDRGLHEKIQGAAWEEICRSMEKEFREGRFEEGALDGIRAIGQLLAEHFPLSTGRAETLHGRAIAL